MDNNWLGTHLPDGDLVQGFRGPVPTYISRFLTASGTTDSSRDMTSNWSGTSTPYFIQPPAGAIYKINRLLFTIVDDAPPAAGGYGGITLVNGLGLKVFDSGMTAAKADLLDGHAIFNTQDWATFCYDVNPQSFGTGNNYVLIRWTFAKAGTPLRLANQDALAVILNDDFSSLVQHHAVAQGWQEAP